MELFSFISGMIFISLIFYMLLFIVYYFSAERRYNMKIAIKYHIMKLDIFLYKLLITALYKIRKWFTPVIREQRGWKKGELRMALHFAKKEEPIKIKWFDEVAF